MQIPAVHPTLGPGAAFQHPDAEAAASAFAQDLRIVCNMADDPRRAEAYERRVDAYEAHAGCPLDQALFEYPFFEERLDHEVSLRRIAPLALGECLDDAPFEQFARIDDELVRRRIPPGLHAHAAALEPGAWPPDASATRSKTLIGRLIDRVLCRVR